jgi:transposase
MDHRPMNWGKNLTLLGAIRLSGWVQMSAQFNTANRERFLRWLTRRLLPRLNKGDVLIMDNLPAHKSPQVTKSCAAHGVRLLYLPPYSPDLNPIEPGWALQKQYVRKCAPRHPSALVRVARRARYRVTPSHARNWFKHSGYRIDSGDLRG